jgi:hypothetical protein
MTARSDRYLELWRLSLFGLLAKLTRAVIQKQRQMKENTIGTTASKDAEQLTLSQKYRLSHVME